MLFADVRGYTALAESSTPDEVARLMNRFYGAATSVLTSRDAIIDKLVGDEVMALFIPGFAGDRYVEKMIRAAHDLLEAVGYRSGKENWLALGIGLAHGPAYVGNIGTGDVKDFTALGDTVNIAARLQAAARAGQIVMTESVYERAADLFPDAAATELSVKGKAAPVSARTIDLSAAALQR